MPVKVRTGTALKSLLDGRTEVQTDGGTVGALLASLGILDRLCDRPGALRRHFNVHVNDGEDIRLQQGLDTPVKNGDVVTILSAIAGGSITNAHRGLWPTPGRTRRVGTAQRSGAARA